MGLPALAIAAVAGGQIYEGMAKKAEYGSQANISKYNAVLQEREAQQTEQRSRYESQRQAEAGSRLMSTLESRGAPVEVLGAQHREIERENLMIGYEGQVAASNARAQGAADYMQSNIYKKAGKSAMTSAYIGAGTTLLSGFGSSKPTDQELARKHGIAYFGVK